MDLFNTNTIKNILPYDGETFYHGQIMTNEKAQYYLKHLLETIAWKNDEAIIFGKLITTKRKIAWYGNENYSYTYSNTTKQALKWTPELLALKRLVEEITNVLS